mgnify:CR=1 FL=1
MNDEICFLRPLISCLGLLRRPPNSYIVSGSGSAEAALSSHIEFSQVRKFLAAIYGSRRDTAVILRTASVGCSPDTCPWLGKTAGIRITVICKTP